MFWWIVLAAVVSLISSYLVGLLLALPSFFLAWPFFQISRLILGKESELAKYLLGILSNLFRISLTIFCGLILGTLVLRNHSPMGFYWVLVASVTITVVGHNSTITDSPTPGYPPRIEKRASWLGYLVAVIVCYLIAKHWLS